MGNFNPSITPGRIVLYTLTADDSRLIDLQRQADGTDKKFNPAIVGHTYPAVVVRSWATSCNLQVLLDGNDAYWATSRKEGDGQGEWAWPPRV